MQHLWIVASLAAAFFQALRYAALKELNRYVSASVATYMRMLFGLPILSLYLFAVLQAQGVSLPKTNLVFWIGCSLTAFLQFGMTILLVWLFQHGNFAVGVMIQRADVILTAIIGSLLFSEVISGVGWMAIALTVVGVLSASAARMAPSAWGQGRGLSNILLGPPMRLGLTSALFAAISYLALREAILSLDPAAGPLANSATAVVATTLVSFVFIGAWLMIRDRHEFARVKDCPWLALLVGLSSAAGSVGWFTASALANASYVAAVAQVQIVFALLISRYWFKETIRPLEILGIVLILGGVMLFRAV